MFRKIILGIISGMAAAISAEAGMIAYTFDVDERYTNWTQSLSVPRFDGALGSLTGVSLSYYGDIRNTVSFQNTGNGTGLFYANFTDTLKVLDASNHTLASLVATPSFSASLSKADGLLFMDLGISHLEGSYAFTGALADFTGAGTVGIGLQETGRVSMGGSGNAYMSVSTKGSGHLQVTYDYTPVPLPASFLLTVTGLAALGLVSRACIAA